MNRRSWLFAILFGAPTLMALGEVARNASASASQRVAAASPAPVSYFLRGGRRVVVARSAAMFTHVGSSPSKAETSGAPAHVREEGRFGEWRLLRLEQHRDQERSVPVPELGEGDIAAVEFSDGRTQFLTTNLYVKPAKGTSPREVQALLERHGLAIVRELTVPGWLYVRTAGDPVDRARELVESGEALEAEPSFFVSTEYFGLTAPGLSDRYFAEQWPLANAGPHRSTDGKGQVRGGDHAHVAEAWSLIARVRGVSETAAASGAGAAVRLAIIDDGFDLQHEDLATHYVASHNFGGPVEAGNLFSAQSPRDFHGTLVAGIAAASANNGVGIAGACPGCRLIAARISGATPNSLAPDQYYDEVFRWVMGQDPDIINCSWGPGGAVASGYFQALFDDVASRGRGGKGTIIVAAAGNGGASMDDNPLASHPKAITVGASDSHGMRHGFSNFGDGLDVLAPTSGGEKASGLSTSFIDRIWSTDNYVQPACVAQGRPLSNGCSDKAGWTPSSPMAGGGEWTGMYSFRFSHTSAAAPLVSGIVGLMLEANPNLTAGEVQTILQDTADRVNPADAHYDGSGFSERYGYGRVNALRAVARAFERGGVVLSDDVHASIDAASPCTRPSCEASAVVARDEPQTSSPALPSADGKASAAPVDDESVPINDDSAIGGTPSGANAVAYAGGDREGGCSVRAGSRGPVGVAGLMIVVAAALRRLRRRGGARR